MFCFSIKMIHNCKYLKLKMRVVSDKAAQLLNVTQSFRVVVFTCFEPKKESFVAQPGLTEWQEWTNRGWRWCLLTLSMFWLLWAVITSYCMLSLLKSVREKLVAFASPCIAVMVQSRCQGIMMTCGGVKNANTTDRCIRREKALVKHAFAEFRFSSHPSSGLSYHPSPCFYPCRLCFGHCEGFGEPVLMYRCWQIP